MKFLGFGLILAVALATTEPAAWADDDHDRARRAYESGEVAGLDQILAHVMQTYRGRVLEIELTEFVWSNRGSLWIYGVKMLTPQGHVVKLDLNAKTMQILRVRGRGADAAKVGD
jgi:uncharacterized membrane protein YkoI